MSIPICKDCTHFVRVPRRDPECARTGVENCDLVTGHSWIDRRECRSERQDLDFVFGRRKCGSIGRYFEAKQTA